MPDKIFQMFFDPARWDAAIAKGVAKDINHGELRKLCSKAGREELKEQIAEGAYKISPPYTAYIPKDDGTDREVQVNFPKDRIVLSILNDLLFDLCPEMVHSSCTSYQRGLGCGRVVQRASRCIVTESQRVGDGTVGWKSDLSKYFDRVPREYIDRAFDAVEQKHGHSVMIDLLREYYHQDIYVDTRDNEVKFVYKSLKQGCAVASWLADVILYHIDEALSSLDGYYVRYSDDTLFIGPDYEKAMEIMRRELNAMQMDINPKKLEMLDRNHWFKFLGFSIRGDQISLSSTRIKRFQKEIEARTIDRRDPATNKVKLPTAEQAIAAVNRFLYVGDGQHSWASQVLPILNVDADINELNGFVLDALRAVMTRRTKIGGLGFVKEARPDRGCIDRGRGRHVKTNRERTPQRIEGFRSLRCMANALRTDIGVYRALVASIK